ncbi:MAG: polysaccharide biosynthesis C-terminal domain-containing protein [Candidatus Saccharibacteria bacterium]|nr:polysaccharide biosynthesis C-terminal domain-containing protein [Rhodoferax sp.]
MSSKRLSRGTTASRVVSGSASAWVRIVITVVTQVALVPIYLSSWGADVYGAWLLVQATWTLILAVDSGHQDYVSGECLRLGPTNKSSIITVAVSAAPIALMIAVVNVVIAWVIAHSATVEASIGLGGLLHEQWGASLVLQSIVWLTTGSITALIVRAITPFGYYPLTSWWSAGYAFATAFIPGVAVYMGANLWEASIALATTATIYQLAFLVRLVMVVRDEDLFEGKPDFALGCKQVVHSLWLMFRNLAENFRQQGVRLVLSPLAGVSHMAAFSTMRTGANFASQGLNTVTGPILPELMRFLAARDQLRTESAFAVVWLVLCAALSPGVLVVQCLAPTIFRAWTHGKIEYDPLLFATLSLGVLINALAIPALAVLQGNNLLRPQLFISVIAAVITITGMIMLVPVTGILGAALALLMAEMVCLGTALYIAATWLNRNSMRWPFRAFVTATTSVVVAAMGMAAIAIFPEVNMYLLSVSLLAELAVLVIYWRELPAIARDHGTKLLRRFTPWS